MDDLTDGASESVEAAAELRKPLKIVMVAYPDCQHLDVAGPLEVFARTSRWVHDHCPGMAMPYEIELVASRTGRVRTSSGLELYATEAFADVREADTLLVTGGVGCGNAAKDEDLLAWLRAMAGSTRRIGSICSGALVIAAAGLLKDREATTHWAYCSQLRAMEPDCAIRTNEIYVQSGNIFTSAGVTTGIDLALSLVEADLGRAISLAVAQELVVYRRRPGGQDQFSRFLEAERRDDRFGQVQLWMLDNLDQHLPVERLAEIAGMSPRNFSRRFKEAVGVTPAAYLLRLRVEEARRQIEAGAVSLKAVAARCGLQDEQNLRRAFRRSIGISPASYRERFAGETPSEIS